MPAEIVVAPAVLGAFVAWVVALVSGLRMVSLRAPGVTIGYLAFHGTAFFDATKFQPEAAPHMRRLGRAFVAFFLFVLLAAALAAWVASTGSGTR